MAIVLEYTDSSGIPRKVLVPEGADPTYAEEGIPYSLDVSTLYPNDPNFSARLTRALWALGLVKPDDFLKPGAPEKVSRALAEARRADTFDIMTLAERMRDNGGK